ncbi:MAG: siroheme synthase CysG [bacterium]|nr:siroheme synthase CysG [bacterium]
MDFLPLFLEIKGQPVLVVGGAEGARNKLELVLKAGGKITLLAPEVHASIEPLLSELTWKKEAFNETHLAGVKLVFVCTNEPDLAAKVSRLAQERGLPINVVDVPELCSFIMPSIIDRSPLVMAVSSSGNCPRLSRLVRAKLETLFPQSYSRLAQMMGEFRDKSRTLFKDAEERRQFWDKIFNSPIVEMFLSGKEKMAQEALEREIASHHLELDKHGVVSLVGAGPGDPDLLTLRALRLIQNADVLVYDRLVSPVILDYARREAEKIYVGKKSAEHSVPQEGINQILVDKAKEGKNVVRLKGGDPFIFGRGGEEIELLVQSGIEFQVVPGITAASGAGTYAGIPLTHRDCAQSVRFITGHMKKDGSLELDWEHMTQANQTLVFYMGLSTLPVISERLIAHGVEPQMPVALIERATTYNMRVIITNVSEMARKAQEEHLEPPTLVIIGKVVGLRKTLKWYEPADFDDPSAPPFLQP